MGTCTRAKLLKLNQLGSVCDKLHALSGMDQWGGNGAQKNGGRVVGR